MKQIHATAILTAVIVSGPLYAGVDDDDVLYGTWRFAHDTLSPSQGAPFDIGEAIRKGQQGNDSDVLYGSREHRSTRSEPYEPLMYDRDDRDDHLNRRS